LTGCIDIYTGKKKENEPVCNKAEQKKNRKSIGKLIGLTLEKNIPYEIASYKIEYNH